MISPEHAEFVRDFDAFGVTAFTTTRQFGTLVNAAGSPDAARRWELLAALARDRGTSRLATASQVHGNTVLAHEPGWDGWRRFTDADGHFALDRETAMAVTVADCVPVFLAHPGGSIALLHSGWRGTAARIVERGIAQFTSRGLAAAELRMHLGPAICGTCYEVSADVARQVTGRDATGKVIIDLRAIIADHARAAGVRDISISPRCTKCDNDTFFSHRAGDAGRQVAVIFATRRPMPTSDP